MKKLVFYFILISGFQNIFTSQQALFDAIDKENVPEIEALLKRSDVDINLPNNQGMTPLHWSINTDEKKIVEILLKNRANVDTINSYGSTPLLYLIEQDIGIDEGFEVDTVELLLQYGANTNIQDNKGNTALIEAARNGYHYIIKSLLKNGAKLNIMNKEKQTALDLAFNNETDLKEYVERKRKTIFKLLDGYYKDYLNHYPKLAEIIIKELSQFPYVLANLVYEYKNSFFDYLEVQLGKPLPENYIPIIKEFLKAKQKRKSNRPSSQIAKRRKTDDEMVDD